MVQETDCVEECEEGGESNFNFRRDDSFGEFLQPLQEGGSRNGIEAVFPEQVNMNDEVGDRELLFRLPQRGEVAQVRVGERTRDVETTHEEVVQRSARLFQRELLFLFLTNKACRQC